jgi:hypothetical protein
MDANLGVIPFHRVLATFHTMYNISQFYLNSFVINNINTGGNSDAATEHLHLMISGTKKKVKCTLVQALRFCTGRTAHRGSRGIAVLFLDHGTRGA